MNTNIEGKDPDLQHFQHLEPDKAPGACACHPLPAAVATPHPLAQEQLTTCVRTGYRLTTNQPWMPKYSNYPFAMFFQACFTALGPALLNEPLYYSTVTFFDAVPFMNLTSVDMMKHWVGRCLVIAWMFAMPLALHGAVKGALFSLVPYTLLGIIYYLFSQVSHLSETCHEPAPPARDSRTGKAEWAVHQVVTSNDYSNSSWLWGFLSIGLNNQIVHHLFPTIEPSHYSDLAPIVQATCDQYGVKYTTHASWAAAFRQHLSWVARLNAVDPAAEALPAPCAAAAVAAPAVAAMSLRYRPAALQRNPRARG